MPSPKSSARITVPGQSFKPRRPNTPETHADRKKREKFSRAFDDLVEAVYHDSSALGSGTMEGKCVDIMRIGPANAQRAFKGWMVALAVWAVLIPARAAPVLQTLYQFGMNPKNPRAGLAQGNDGDFYGVTMFGGDAGESGTVFKITPGAVLTPLFSFNGTNGSRPVASLVLGSDFNFYGTTQGGGTNDNGTVFRITSQGSFTSLLQFTGANGRGPAAALVPGTDGNFYGTTQFGGANTDNGTVFRITLAGVFTSLFSFPSNGRSGTGPIGSLVQGTDGNFYGTTSGGGATTDNGTVFRITPSGGFTSIFSFNGANGSVPTAGLARGNDGNFYGTTQFGGTTDNGTVFRITPAGAITTLYSFRGPDGNYPLAALTLGGDGNFYGTTSGDRAGGGTNTFGTVFRITPGGSLTTLAYFGGTNGATPWASLLRPTDGNFYGTTFEQGANGGGTVFRLVEPPAITSITAVRGGDVVVRWTSFPRGTYRVEYKPTLTAANWTPLAPDITATGSSASITNRVSLADAQRFYRVRLLP
jgi:uncharacterized repeat protein (TIGR03803 family)